MALKYEVLRALQAQSGFVSGEMLAKRFGKSRTAVSKAVQALRAEGYTVEAVTKRGYRLAGHEDLITPQVLSPLLAGPVDVRYYPTVDSTNSEAKRLILAGAAGDLLLVADEQTAGRGRQGKSFYSPARTGIYMTLVVHPNRALQNAVSATTAAAVAVCRAVEALTDCRPRIKWVNDVYLDGKKICGILTEAVLDVESRTVESMVIGIGMNLTTVSFPPEVENAACLHAHVGRAKMIAEITNQLLAVLDADYSAFMDAYRSRSMLLGQSVYFLQNGVKTPATAVGIDDTGGLVVRLEDGSQTTLRSGEITVRPRTE